MAVDMKPMSANPIQDFVRKSSKPLRILRKCPGCQDTCRTKIELYNHTAKCRQDAHICPVEGCPFACLYSQHMRYHSKLHCGAKGIQCPKCQYTCSTNTMLKSHMRTHEEIARFRCADCPFSTKQPSHLSQHLASSGHIAAPVLSEDGSVPDDEYERDFKNHIRSKKRMAESDEAESQSRTLLRTQPDPYGFQGPVIEIAPIPDFEDNDVKCQRYSGDDDDVIVIENDVAVSSDEVKVERMSEVRTYKSVMKIRLMPTP